MAANKALGARIVLGFIGISTLVFAFQNCAPSGLNSMDDNSNSYLNSSQSGATVNYTEGNDSYQIPSIDGGSSIKLRNLSVKIDSCASDDSQLNLEITGAGSQLSSCTESYISGRDNSFRCSDNYFVDLATSPDWKYNGALDIWSISVNLKNHNVFVPGKYKSFFKNASGAYQIDYEIGNPAGANCFASAPAVPSNCPDLTAAKGQCSDFVASTGHACVVSSQTGERLFYLAGFGPAKSIQINCTGSVAVTNPIPTPTPADPNLQPPPTTGYGKEVIIKNQFGRVLVMPIPYNKYDYANGPDHDIIAYELNFKTLAAQGRGVSNLLFGSVRYNGSGADRIHSISTIPGDLSESASCISSRFLRDVSLRASTVGTDTRCNLDINKTYYVNVQTRLKCQTISDVCKFHFSFTHGR